MIVGAQTVRRRANLSVSAQCRYFRLGDITLESGEVLPNARLGYVALGSLNRSRDNAIVLPTYFTGTHRSYFSLIGRGRPLDPRRYFIVIPNMFGNGVSSSPSTSQNGLRRRRFPDISLYDNVKQQARLVFEHLQVEAIELVCGWSLGGIQTYYWAALHPEKVRKILPFGSAARVSPYNFVFLEGLRCALEADRNWNERGCRRAPVSGLCAFARIYAGWAYSHEFFRTDLYRQLGHHSLEALLQSWEDEHLRLNANDLWLMLRTWQRANVAAIPGIGQGFEGALRRIRAKSLLVACTTDRYFAPQDNEYEARFIRDCDFRQLESPFGHCAFSPGKVDSCMTFLDSCLHDLLTS